MLRENLIQPPLASPRLSAPAQVAGSFRVEGAGGGGCESQCGRKEQRRSAAATPCHGKTREVGEADKSPGFLLLGDESSISGGVGGVGGWSLRQVATPGNYLRDAERR